MFRVIAGSNSRKPLVRSVRQAKGIELTGNEKLNLGKARSPIDEWAAATQQAIAEWVGQRGGK